MRKFLLLPEVKELRVVRLVIRLPVLKELGETPLIGKRKLGAVLD